MLALTETHCPPHSKLPDPPEGYSFHFPTYTSTTTTAHTGGVLLLVPNSFVTCSHPHLHEDMIIAHLKSPGGFPLSVITAYRSQQPTRHPDFFELLHAAVLGTPDSNWFVLGDFNAPPRTGIHNRDLRGFIDSFNAVCYPPVPPVDSHRHTGHSEHTRLPHDKTKNPTTLDHIIYAPHLKAHIRNQRVLPTQATQNSYTDHLPVLVTLSISAESSSTSQTRRRRYQRRRRRRWRPKWDEASDDQMESFEKEVALRLPAGLPCLEAVDSENAPDLSILGRRFLQTIRQAEKKFIGVRPERKRPSPPFWTTRCAEAKASLRNCLGSPLQTQKRREYRQVVQKQKAAWRARLLNRITTMIKKHQVHPSKLEKDLKLLSTCSPSPPVSVIGEGGSEISNPSEICQVLRNHLHERQQDLHISESHCNETAKLVQATQATKRSNVNTDDGEKDLTKEEVQEAIRDMKTGRAVGPDNFFPEAILAALKPVTFFLLFLFSCMFRLSFVPPCWKKATVIPTPKVKNTTLHPHQFRFIFLSSRVLLLYERILLNRLEKWADENNLLSGYQTGFRRHRECSDNIVALVSLAMIQPLYVCFIDFKRAFPSIWLGGLFFRLRKYGCSTRLMKALESLNCGFTYSVNMDGEESDPVLHGKGLREGSILSPFLFSLYVEDLVRCLLACGFGPRVGLLLLPILLYADDAVLIATSVAELQAMLLILQWWCRRWRLQLNPEKCAAMVISRHRQQGTVRVRINNIGLKTSQSFKYLGVVVSSDLSWDAHINYVRQRVLHRLGFVRNLRRLGATPAQLRLVYSSYIRPVIDHASPAWFPFTSQRQRTALQQLQNYAARSILGLPSSAPSIAAMGELGLPLLPSRLSDLTLRFRERKQTHNCPVIIDVLQMNKFLKRSSWSQSWTHKVILLQSQFAPDRGGPDPTSLSVRISQQRRSMWLKASTTTSPMTYIFHLVNPDGKFDKTLGAHPSCFALSLVYLLRGGAHWLPSHTGRYSGTPPRERMCTACGHRSSIFHSLFMCEATAEERWRLFSSLGRTSLRRLRQSSPLEVLLDFLTFRLPQGQAVGAWLQLVKKSYLVHREAPNHSATPHHRHGGHHHAIH